MSENVAYPGPPGSHSSAAAAALFPSETLVPLVGFRAVADAVTQLDVGHGVLPIESSLAGPGGRDARPPARPRLCRSSPRRCCRSATASRRRRPFRSTRSASCCSHPSALEQCRRLLDRHAARRRSLPAATTARGGAGSGRGRRSDRGGDRRRRGASLLRADRARTTTSATSRRSRASSRSRRTRSISGRRDTARTAFSFVTNHRPGALHQAIEPFAHAGLDLVRLVARPIPSAPWSYRFDAVRRGASARHRRCARRSPSSRNGPVRIASSASTKQRRSRNERSRKPAVARAVGQPYVRRERPRSRISIARSSTRSTRVIELVAQLIRSHKEEVGIGFVDLAREEWMLQYLQRANRGPLSAEGLRRLPRAAALMNAGRSRRRMRRSFASCTAPCCTRPRSTTRGLG